MNEKTEKRPLTLGLFLLRLLSGVAGGIMGTLVLFVVYFLLSPILPPTKETTSISTFVIIIMTFVGTLTANSVAGLILTFMDHEKYSRRKTIFMHVFLFNLILFFLSIPLYILSLKGDMAASMAAVHLIISAFVSALIMEVLSGSEYSLLGIYSAALGTYAAIGLSIMLLNIGIPKTSLMFLAMPTIWFLLQFSSGAVEWIYDNFVKLYGVDALNVKTDIGGDSLPENPETDEEEADTNEKI